VAAYPDRARIGCNAYHLDALDRRRRRYDDFGHRWAAGGEQDRCEKDTQ
jgi:hypothetical protein